MSKQHFIFDFETMGQDVFHIPILDCSYMVFDWDRFTSSNPYSLEELVLNAQKDKLDVVSQVKEFGARYTQRDIDWWLSQSESAKKVLKPSSSDIRVEKFIKNFIDYLSFMSNNTKITYWWSRANTFDPLILQRWATVVGKFDVISQYLQPWFVRDTRTYIDAKLNFPDVNDFIPVSDKQYWNKTFIKHDSRFDIVADILRLQAICRAENDMEMINR